MQVDDGGTLALMQQMVNLKELGSSPPNAPPPSPAHSSALAAPSPNPFSATPQPPSLPQRIPFATPFPDEPFSASLPPSSSLGGVPARSPSSNSFPDVNSIHDTDVNSIHDTDVNMS